ncbi:hypothetical protein B0A49_02156 [Cryomyces minteri]|uniref:Translation initiation factor eIF4e n=1 Tax=Cryomyces minteri TaxID=331657 RepID=A0A4U0XCV5_9PEZI|nr:hypothetical protein B0A49_02156 [Cryomyces minteri]
MAQPPSRLRELSADSSTTSPARGAEMHANLLQKLRPPPLVHAWDFWHDRADRRAPTSTITAAPSPSSPNTTPSYEARLAHLSAIRDVRSFWATLNNFPLASLPLRDSIHLFHHGTAPVWEDARNVHGGAWTFRVPKPAAAQFWREVCMMAVGEQLQAAVQRQAQGPKRAFSDDICGVSLSVRFTAVLVSVWNRDAGHVAGVQEVLRTVLEGLSEEIRPKSESAYYYRKHAEHNGFKAPPAVGDEGGKTGTGEAEAAQAGAEEVEGGDGGSGDGEKKAGGSRVSGGVDAVVKEVEDMGRAMQEVALQSEDMQEKVAAAEADDSATGVVV